MGLNHLDLVDAVSSEITIDRFYPKTGEPEEVIVVGFKTMDEGVGEDLADFIEKSAVDTLDVEVSPNPDSDGEYIVFVEFTRDKNFIPYFSRTLEDLKNVVGRKHKWSLHMIDTDKLFDSKDKRWKKYIELDQDEYLMKYPSKDEEEEAMNKEEQEESMQEDQEQESVEEGEEESIQEGLDEFLSDSLLESFDYDDDNILSLYDANSDTISFKIIGFGKEADLFDKRFKEMPVMMENSYERNKLLSFLGNEWSDDIIQGNHLVQRDGNDNLLILEEL